MRNLYRGLKNVWRNRSRTAIVLVILALAAGLGLVMLGLEEGIGAQIGEMEARVGTVIEVRPAGVYGMMAVTDALLPPAMVEEIGAMPGVASVAPYVMARYQGASAGAAGFRGRRMVYGVAPGQALTVLGGGEVEVVAGRGLEPGDAGLPVVVVGEFVAENEGVRPGDRLLIEERWFRVVGIHRSSVRMAGMGVFMPYDVALEVFGLEGLTQIYVWAETIGRVDALRDGLQDRYGAIADVVAQKDSLMGRLEDSFASLGATSRLGLVLALLTSAVVVFGTTFLVVRERAREIGILKAVGAGRRDILLQFGSEAVFLSLGGAVLGLALFAFLGPSLAALIVQVNLPGPAMPRLGEEMLARFGGGELMSRSGAGEFLSRFGGDLGRSFLGAGGMGLAVGTVQVALTWTLAGKAILGGLALGLAGGLVPSLLAARLKPAEVIRRD